MDCFEKLYNEIRSRFATDDEVAFSKMSEPLATIMKECREKLRQPLVSGSCADGCYCCGTSKVIGNDGYCNVCGSKAHGR